MPEFETPPDWVTQAAEAVEPPQTDQGEALTSSEAVEPQDIPDEFAPQIAATPEAEAVLDQEEAQPEKPTEVEEIPETVEIEQSEVTTSEKPAASEQSEQTEMDEAFAWLESLAAKQGAEPDSLLVSSEDRPETAPDWIQQELKEIETESEEKIVASSAEVVEEEEEEPAAAAEQLPDWMTPADQEKPDSIDAPEIVETLPNWFNEEGLPQSNVEDDTLAVSEDQPEENVETPIIEPSDEEPIPDWINESALQEPSTRPVFETATEEPAEVQEVESPIEKDNLEPLPDWLSSDLSEAPQALEEEVTPDSEPQVLPDWLQADTSSNANVPSETSMTTDSGEAPPLPDWLKDLEFEQVEEPLPIDNTFSAEPIQPPETGEISQIPEEMILQAQSAIEKSQIEYGLSIYQRLIEQDQKIDEIIHDLRDALYRFPVDSYIWQTLGDAYMHANQVQEALDAFTKAEELLK